MGSVLLNPLAEDSTYRILLVLFSLVESLSSKVTPLCDLNVQQDCQFSDNVSNNLRTIYVSFLLVFINSIC